MKNRNADIVESHDIETKTPKIQSPRKYEMLPEAKHPKPVYPNGNSEDVYRIRALVDIPLHGVKAGDLGGFVEDDLILSHKGSCWIGGDAIVARPYESRSYYDDRPLSPIITQDALVTGTSFVYNYATDSVVIKDNAVVLGRTLGNTIIKDNAKFMDGVVKGNVTIADNAIVRIARIFTSSTDDSSSVYIGGNVTIDGASELSKSSYISAKDNEKISIKGSARLNKVNIEGNFDFNSEANLENVTFEGNTTIFGTPHIQPDVKFTGRNVISGDSFIPASAHVHDVCMDTGVLSHGVTLQTTHGKIDSMDATTSFVGKDPTVYIDTIHQIEADYESYTTDIVKLIKYPGMVDTSIPEVGNFVVKLRSTKRSMKMATVDVLAEMTETLELAFVNAENKVQTLVTSHLSDDSKKSLKTAEQMFALACNDASTEPEKRLGYKAGMKALEGVVAVSETAVEQMKARVGVLELEA